MKGLGTVNPAITCILFKLQLFYIILMFVLRNLHFHYVSTFRYEEAENKKRMKFQAHFVPLTFGDFSSLTLSTLMENKLKLQ